MIAYAFLQTRRLKRRGGKKESEDRRRNRACPLSGRRFSISSLGLHPSAALIVRNFSPTLVNRNCQSSARHGRDASERSAEGIPR